MKQLRKPSIVRDYVMYTVKLMRRRDEREEEYGRVILEGNHIKYQGLTLVFQAYLQRGIQNPQNVTLTPSDGISFLKNLKYHHFDAALYATDMTEGVN